MIQRPFLSKQSDSFHSGTQLQSQQIVIEEDVRTITTSSKITDLCSCCCLFMTKVKLLFTLWCTNVAVYRSGLLLKNVNACF